MERIIGSGVFRGYVGFLESEERKERGFLGIRDGEFIGMVFSFRRYDGKTVKRY